jgi:L-ascorbate metabolism protein UlaG (beta-lactamase superfamily)
MQLQKTLQEYMNRRLEVEIRLVRHATLVIELDGRTLLVDPMLSDGVNEKFRSFLPTSPPNSNPTVPLPAGLDLSSILSSVDAVFVTHTHPDHFDDAAVNQLLKQLSADCPIFCQPLGEGQQQSDEEKISNFGFSPVQTVEPNPPPFPFDGIEVFRTDGQHGPNNIEGDGVPIGPVSGFVLRSQTEPTLYIAGDTIFCPEVQEALDQFQPEIVVVNAGAAQIPADTPPITMSKEDVEKVCTHMPSATVIAVHMDALDHCLEHRTDLANFIESKGLSAQVRIPADGESMKF